MRIDASEPAEGTRLSLYVAGRSTRSLRAIDNLQRIAEVAPGRLYDIEIIDVVQEPERAERERILATPTLLKDFPPPRRRITGDLSDMERIIRIIWGELTGRGPTR